MVKNTHTHRLKLSAQTERNSRFYLFVKICITFIYPKRDFSTKHFFVFWKKSSYIHQFKKLLNILNTLPNRSLRRQKAFFEGHHLPHEHDTSSLVIFQILHRAWILGPETEEPDMALPQPTPANTAFQQSPIFISCFWPIPTTYRCSKAPTFALSLTESHHYGS
jgi:hypothetical protein